MKKTIKAIVIIETCVEFEVDEDELNDTHILYNTNIRKMILEGHLTDNDNNLVNKAFDLADEKWNNRQFDEINIIKMEILDDIN